MADLSTSYLGLNKNPSSPQQPVDRHLDNLKRCEDAGLGAVVLKSISRQMRLPERKPPIMERPTAPTPTPMSFARGE